MFAQVPSAHAATVGGFEIDGNLLDDSGGGDPIDWSTPPPNLTNFTDLPSSADNIFATGSKDNAPSGWDCDMGSGPDKDDIVSGQVAFRRVAGDQWIYVNFFRAATNGDAHMAYEFNKSSAPASADCPDVAARTPGDQRISFDTDQGGSVINVVASNWNGTAWNDVALGANAGGAVNIPPSLTIPGHANGDFGEAAINLTKTIGEIGCNEFAGVHMKTRASTAPNSTLKDYTKRQALNIGECPQSTTTKSVRNASVTGSQFAGSTDAAPGDVVEYKLNYTNAGPGIAHNVVVTDTLAGNQTLVAGSCSPACSVSGSTLTWNLGDVAPGSVSMTFRVQIVGTFAAGTATEIKNTATATTTEEGQKPSGATTVTVKTPSTSANKDVRNVTTSGSFGNTANAAPGDVLEYRVIVTNAGPGVATGVVVTDAVASGSTYVANSCTGGTSCSFSSPTVTWQVGTLAAGASVTLTFRVTLSATFPPGTTAVKNTAVVDSAQENPKNSDETTTNVTSTTNTSGNKDVRNVTTSGSFGNTANASPGDVLEYRIIVSNTGNAAATGVVVTDAVASGSTYLTGSCTGGTSCSFSSPTVTWQVGTLAAGASVTLTFKVTLAASFPAGTTQVKNTAVIDSDQEEPENSDETTTNVAGNANTSGNKDVRNVTTSGSFGNTANASPGDVLEYRIIVSNTGNSPATGVVVTDTVASGSTYLTGSCTGGTSCSFSSPTVTWQVGTLAAGASVALTFRVTLAATFPAGTTPVKNTAVVDSDQEEPENSDETTTNVAANPNTSGNKDVRNVTASGSFGNTANASPGDTLEYRIIVTNTGNAAATGVVVTDTVASGSTYLAGSCTGGTSCSFSSPTVTWQVGTLAAGGSVTLTFKVTLATNVTAGTTAVKNVAVIDTDQEDPDDSDETTTNVTATSNLTLAKAANQSTVRAGDKITYTLTYGNTGNGAATGTTIVETVPAGTTYESCTGGCTRTDSTVTWDVGTVDPGETGSVTMTITVSATIDACGICNVAQIKSLVQNGGTPVSSNQACVPVQPTADPSTAKANGDALGLKVYAPLLGIPLINAEISKAASSRTGPGSALDDDQALNLNILGVAGLASIAKASVLTTTSASQVTPTLGARQTSTAEVLGLNLLGGVVTADVVRSVASTTARGDASSYSAAGTTAVNLKVLGQALLNVAPGTKIRLDGTALNKGLYGAGSYVAVNEQTGSTSGPASGVLSGGTYKSDLTVTAVRVLITGGTIGGLLTLGGAPVEITVARATAHSEHKQTRVCDETAPVQAVSGHAVLASAFVNPLLGPVDVGFVQIPASGGSANNSVTASALPADGTILTTEDAATNTTGTNGATSSTSSSYAQAAGVCVLRLVAQNCLVKATTIRSQANSTATKTSRSSNATGTQFVGLMVAGIPINANVAPNTVIQLPLGIGFVVLNEQVPDGPETGHTGLTVRAIHVVLNAIVPPLVSGAEVIVAEAHSDATFR
ncbi:hypothetical protein ASD81_14715 [Nocardioides sp. Root614]|nr:hypothetical protein ASD81_14715 [Nocardioides sp. Root614]KRA89413.1 hypothetical protein ASD84_14980 [Nocardioides sp. Root682]